MKKYSGEKISQVVVFPASLFREVQVMARLQNISIPALIRAAVARYISEEKKIFREAMK